MVVDLEGDGMCAPGGNSDAAQEESSPDQPARTSQPTPCEGPLNLLRSVVFSPRSWLRYSGALLEAEGNLRGEIEPSDLLAEAFARAWRHRHSFHGTTRAEAGAWFAMVLRRTTLDLLRGRRRSRRSSSVTTIEEIEDSKQRPAGGVDGHDGLQVLLDSEDVAATLQAIALLPDKEAYAILEIRLGSATLGEVAARLSTSRHAVSMLLWKGTRRLHNRLRRALGEGP